MSIGPLLGGVGPTGFWLLVGGLTGVGAGLFVDGEGRGGSGWGLSTG